LVSQSGHVSNFHFDHALWTKLGNFMDTQRGLGKPFRLGNRHGKGRPAGSRNKATIALQELLDGEGAAITHKAIELAKAGNERALRLCLERLIPPCRERPVRLTLPPDITTAAGVSGALAAILAAVAQGDITTGEAVQLANVLEVRRKTIETEEFERRLTEIENRTKPG
jgi:hypothetical protein